MILIMFTGLYVLTAIKDYFYGREITETYTKANIVANISADCSDGTRFNGAMITSKLQENNIATGLFSASAKIIITDRGGSVIYDNSRAVGNAEIHITPIFKSVIEGNNNNNISALDDGSHTLEVGVPVKNDSGNITGAVFILRSLSQADDFLSESRQVLIWILLVICIVYTVISSLVARIVVNPLTKLTKAIEGIEHGNKNQHVDVVGHDEIALLSTSFNAMSKQVDVLEEKRTQFISDASHELKTPLATIKLSCESALSALQAPNADISYATEFLNDINGEIDRLNRIIEKLLALTKSNSQSTTPELKTVDINLLIVSVVKKLAPLAREKDINLTFVGSDSEDHINMLLDYDKIYEAVYNIVDNSIKYTNENGSVKISLSCDIAKTIIEIEDTGIGIPKEKEGFVFDRFYRVDRARSRETGGTGLGLAIAKDAVESHGGHIELLSEEGVGSKFIIILPYTGK